MAVSVTGILPGYTYIVLYSGAGLSYDSVEYHIGDTFVGVDGADHWVDLGGGSQVNSYAAPDYDTNFTGASLELSIPSGEIVYPQDTTKIEGFAIEFLLAASEIVVPDTTRLTGFAIELIDYPFYAFQITKTIRQA